MEKLGPQLVRLAKFLVVALPLGVALGLTGVQISSQPGFCGSCHYMQPYYESWATSTHKDVACVECHIPPGIASEFRKKYEALAMVARYFTGTYSTNPWAEVPDSSCLRPGCHEQRLLLGKEVFKGILFDHRPHLGELRREKRLRCTSCHSQIVQGQHIAVTESTCVLCHFKETEPNEGTARCTLCHEIPKEVTTRQGYTFNHSEVEQFGVDCTLCHKDVVRGGGEVPQERCYNCHNEPHRLEKYGQTEFLHQTHVTEHKVECLHCHLEIRHGLPERQWEQTAVRCSDCHSRGHSPVMDLYVGIGSGRLPLQPSPMYLAGVGCEGCHQVLPAGGGQADAVSCMNCHGSKYDIIYRSWKAAVDRRLEGITSELQRVRAEVQTQNQTPSAKIQERLDRAAEAIRRVQRGRGIHNPDFAAALLSAAHEDLNAARRLAGLDPQVKPWLETPYETPCVKCHLGVEYLTPEAFGRAFPHEGHVVSSKLRCVVCHDDRTPHDEGEGGHGRLKLEEESCQACHTQLEGPPPPESCFNCHVPQIVDRSEKVEFPHSKHVSFGFACRTCHQGVDERPHREFAGSEGALPPLGHDFCARCHSKDVPPQGSRCAKCHVSF